MSINLSCLIKQPKIVAHPYQNISISSPKMTKRYQQFNNSIIEYNNRTIMVYRTGWFFGRLHICELDENWNVLWNSKLEFPYLEEHEMGQEDGRLFIYNNQLYLTYTATGRNAETNDNYFTNNPIVCEITPNFTVGKIHIPHYKYRQYQEKNWTFFENENTLYCNYSIIPHIVLKINLVNDEATVVSGTETRATKDFSYGCVRGGTCPILLNNEYYSFFHYVEFHKINDIRNYSVGVFTFEKSYPYRIKRFSEGAILTYDENKRPKEWYINTTFPCGAYIKNDSWCISYGAYDFSCNLAKFKIDDIEKCLVPVG